ncbi:trehalose-phosphatase-domain-containing protein [Dichotomocladium elegans]|nr:trehalose-phosphatase-domain-containing protein [Dichotomocladium elegans]
MSRIIHVAYLTSCISFPSTAHSNITVLPPSPPQSPRHYDTESFKLENNLMWQPAWHMIMGAQTSHSIEHVTVSLASHQPASFLVDYLDPLFEGNSAALPEEDAFRHYLNLNSKFADQVIDQYRSEDDIIWLHDYALALLPAILRHRLPKATIALAIYAQFPTLDNRIPEHLKIMQSMLAADLLAFQMKRDIDAFETSCAGPISSVCLLGQSAAIPHQAIPRSIRNTTTSTARSSSSSSSSKRIVLCHDTDLSLVPHTIAAMDLAAAVDPSLEFIHIRPSSSYTPSPTTATATISTTYSHESLNPETYQRLLASADATLIMGHNPAATVAAQACLSSSTAPLVVSSRSPLSAKATLVVDENGLDAHVIAVAVGSPRRDALDANDAAARMGVQLLDFANTSTRKTPLLNTTLLSRAYQHAKRRLMLFDYDGTLAPIVSNPDDARPTPALLHYLQTLCKDPRNVVWVVSGRDQATLEAWLGQIKGLGLSAEHGSFMKHPDQQAWIDMLAQASPDMMRWQSRALKIFSEFTAETPGTVVEQKKASITWHYRNALDAQQALAQVEACHDRLVGLQGGGGGGGIDILRGKMNLEVRSLLVNKGHVVRRIQEEVAADFILCAGDDRTDEDMFRALANYPGAANCVHIGHQNVDTLAQSSIESPEQFVAFLGQLCSQLKNSAL